MTRFVSYPKAGAVIRALVTGGFMNSAGIGFALYILIICYPPIVATPAMLMDVRTGDVSMSAAGESSLLTSVPLLLLGLLVFARHGLRNVFRGHQIFLACFLVFVGSVVLLSGFTATGGSTIAQISQFGLTAVAFVLCLAFWQANEQDIDCALAMAVFALGTALVSAAIVQGFHDYRWVGLIHPNHYARYAYIVLVLHAILLRRIALPVFLVCLTAAYMVSARTIMIGIILFYGGYLCTTFGGIPKFLGQQIRLLNRLATALLVAPAVVVIGYLAIDGERLLARLSSDFAVFDADRGVLSGFTGRASSWNGFLESMPGFVAFGYGFRSSRYNLHSVHSGVLSYFMDFGMVLGGLLLVAIVSRAIYLIAENRRGDRRAFLCGLAIATTLVIQCFEPDNFNVGFIGSFFFMLVLAFTRRLTHQSFDSQFVTTSTDYLMAPNSNLRLSSHNRKSTPK